MMVTLSLAVIRSASGTTPDVEGLTLSGGTVAQDITINQDCGNQHK